MAVSNDQKHQVSTDKLPLEKCGEKSLKIGLWLSTYVSELKLSFSPKRIVL